MQRQISMGTLLLRESFSFFSTIASEHTRLPLLLYTLFVMWFLEPFPTYEARCWGNWSLHDSFVLKLFSQPGTFGILACLLQSVILTVFVKFIVFRKVAESNKIEGYPTFAYFKNGRLAWKINERTEDGFYNFMKKYAVAYLSLVMS